MYLSAKAKSYLYLVGLLIFTGIALGRPELLVISVPFAVSLVIPLFSQKPDLPEIRPEIESCELIEGSDTELTVHLNARKKIPLLTITHELKLLNTNETYREKIQVSLKPGEKRTLKFPITTGTGPGRYRAGRFDLTGLDSSGMAYAQTTVDKNVEITVFPAINALQNVNLINRPRLYHGYYTSSFRGEGLEFSEIKEYRHGDSLKHINWRKSLKWGSLLVNDRYLDRNIDVVIIIDSLTQISGPGGNYLHIAARGAASLAHHYTERNDRVGLIDYDGTIDPILPQAGPAQLKKILARLARLRESPLYVAKKAATIPGKVLPPQGIVYGFTSLSDERAYQMFVDLAARGFYLVLIYISPLDLAMIDEQRGDEDSRLTAEIWELRQEAKLAGLKKLGARLIRPQEGKVGHALADFSAGGGVFR